MDEPDVYREPTGAELAKLAPLPCALERAEAPIMSPKARQPATLIGHPCSSQPDRERCTCSLSMLRPVPEPGDDGTSSSTSMAKTA